jgi:hypothetical protein
MKLYYLSVILVLTSLYPVLAQSGNACACCSENHTAFDFWVGDWKVYNTGGKLIGTNKVLKLQEGCVVQENWEAANNTSTGTSYNFFDSSDSTWNQVWISSTGNVLNLKGNLSREGVMILKSELAMGTKGKYYNQITWSKNTNGTVTQRWDILNENGVPISNAFEGIYKK